MSSKRNSVILCLVGLVEGPLLTITKLMPVGNEMIVNSA